MIPGWLQQPLFQWLSERTIRYVSPVPGADALTRRVLDQARRDFFVGGPITVHASSPRLMAGMWIAGRETILVDDALDRAAKEVIAAGVSQANRCPYCVDMHVSMAHGARWHAAADLILAGAKTNGANDGARQLAEWALSSRDPGAEAVRRPPFPTRAIPEAVGTAFFFHYINRVVNVFFSDRPLPLPQVLERVRPRLARVFGIALRESVSRPADPGRGLPLLPRAALPRDLAWSKPNARVADALARWDGAMGTVAGEYAPPHTRERLTRAVASWYGEDPPPGTGWLHEALDGLDDSARPWAELALMAAVASYRVPPDLVARVRRTHGNDEAVVAAVAWGGHTAAKRIAGWLRDRPS